MRIRELIIVIIFTFLICCSNLFKSENNPYSGITETVIDSLDEWGHPITRIISEDPDDWNINYNPPFPDSLLIPDEFSVGPSFPNPTVDSTFIKLSVASKKLFNIFIKDREGHIVKVIYSDSLNPGYHYIFWNLDNNEGKKVKSDIYRCFYNIENARWIDSTYYSISGYGDIKVE